MNHTYESLSRLIALRASLIGSNFDLELTNQNRLFYSTNQNYLDKNRNLNNWWMTFYVANAPGENEPIVSRDQNQVDQVKVPMFVSNAPRANEPIPDHVAHFDANPKSKSICHLLEVDFDYGVEMFDFGFGVDFDFLVLENRPDVDFALGRLLNVDLMI